MLLFYCRECEATFESEPDGTGYEQAPCPACGDICLTVQFEKEEQDRHCNEATLVSFIGLLTGWFPSSLIGQLSGLFPIHRQNASDSTLDAGQEEKGELPSIRDPATVCAFERLGEANTCCALLDQFGIQAQLVQISGANPFLPNAADGVVVQVPCSDIERARKIIDEYHSIKEERCEARSQDGNITFECQECGAEITFPMHRQGGVEVCPHCGEYVDVPE